MISNLVFEMYKAISALEFFVSGLHGFCAIAVFFTVVTAYINVRIIREKLNIKPSLIVLVIFGALTLANKSLKSVLSELIVIDDTYILKITDTKSFTLIKREKENKEVLVEKQDPSGLTIVKKEIQPRNVLTDQFKIKCNQLSYQDCVDKVKGSLNEIISESKAGLNSVVQL